MKGPANIMRSAGTNNFSACSLVPGMWSGPPMSISIPPHDMANTKR